MKKYFMTLLLISFGLISCGNNTLNFHGSERYDIDTEISDADATENDNPIYDLKIEMNEKNVLSCRLTFKTKENMKTTVRYFNSEHGYVKDENAAGQDHYFFLWGMHPDSDYTIEIYDTDNTAEPLATDSFRTGPFPEDAVPSTLTINMKNKVLDGFVLFTYWAVSFDSTSYSYPIAMMYDTTGQMVWYYEFDGYSDVVIGDLQYIERSDTVLIALTKTESLANIPLAEAVEIDLEGNIVWESAKIESVYGGLTSWNHTYEKLPDDTIVMLKKEVYNNIASDMVVNIDSDYNVLWYWSFLEHLTLPEYDGTDWYDWIHANVVTMRKDEGVVFVNSRTLSSYYKIAYPDGNILWTLGKDGDFTMLSDNPYPWFEYAHDPEPSETNPLKVLFYDNGGGERNWTRVIEYELDEENMTAQISFEYDGSGTGSEWFNAYGGDADRLENDNIFITIGETSEGKTEFLEITPDKERVWEMVFEEKDDWYTSIYNAQKIATDKLLKRL